MKTKNIFLGAFLILFIIGFNGYGQTNTKLGDGALATPGGHSNTAIGKNALHLSPASWNIAIGRESMGLSTGGGGRNISLGSYSLYNNLGGSDNLVLGYRSMLANTIGGNNIALGKYSLSAVGTNNVVRPGHIHTGNHNIAIGFQSLNYNATGNYNIAQGYRTLSNLDSGQYNVAIGFQSGKDLVSGNNNVFLGTVYIPAGSTNFNNRIILGTGAGKQRIYVNDNGYVGIGLGDNVIPLNSLELKGGISGTMGLRFNGVNGDTAPTVTPNGRVLTVDANGDVVLTLDEGGSTSLNLYTTNGTLAGNRTVFMNNNRLMFDTGSSATDGAIYIGNTSDVLDNDNFPQVSGNYRLYVEGGILSEQVKVALRSTTNWADYVFESDYKLMPLQEVETYIKANKHLPGVDSAEDLVEKGLDLGEMQAKQMEKIEELTLYLIEKDKQIQALTLAVKELQEKINN